MTTPIHNPGGTTRRSGGGAHPAWPGSGSIDPPTCNKGLGSIRAGFSMVELMAVVIIVAVLAMVAVPLTLSALPYAQVRMEAQNAAAIMRQARLKAASTQRPTRVVLDCRDRISNVKNPCVFTMQTASYTEGVLTGWDEVGIGGMERRHPLNASVAVRATTVVKYAPVFWIIFMPSSRTYSSHSPYELEFVPEKFKENDPPQGLWTLSVNNSSGRTTLVRKK